VLANVFGMEKSKYIFFVFLITVLVSLAFPQFIRASDLTIDFSQVTGPAERHATGFEWIFPMNVTAIGPYVSQLKPNIVKDPWGNEQTARDLGAHKIQWLVGNAVVTKNGPGTHWYPWQDYAVWQAWVAGRINSLTQNGQPHEWVIWQEANYGNPDVWSGTQDQFFNTWKIAVQTIRSIRPTDPIVGPSPVPFDATYLEAFLLYAKANNVLPDVLSWHELTDIGGTVPAFNIYSYTPDQIPSHVNTMKQFMQANGITLVNRFDITEYQGFSDNYRPGPTVAFIADLERVGAEGTKGNWADANQLEGLVTDPSTPQPRSIWWVYKKYADMTGNLVTTTLSSAINGFGSYDVGMGKAMVLAGNQGGSGARTIQLNNIPSAIVSGGSVALTLEQIPDTEKAALTSPTIISQSNIPVSGNSVTVSIPSFGTWDAYVITLKKPLPNPIKSAVISATTVTARFDTVNASAGDWLGVYKTGASNTSFLSWKWIDNTTGPKPTTAITNGTVVLTVPNSTETYEVRYFTNGYQLLGSAKVTTGTGPSPTPISIKPGDLNDDGKVDIFDYNILVGDYGKIGSAGFVPSDIDKNGKVDIFDYNLLVANYGK
jgi:hypothetical protein